jgi:hypothetical protein
LGEDPVGGAVTGTTVVAFELQAASKPAAIITIKLIVKLRFIAFLLCKLFEHQEHRPELPKRKGVKDKSTINISYSPAQFSCRIRVHGSHSE